MPTEEYGSFVPETNLNNLYRLVIPASGHDLSDALKDLVDNSFDAGANNIRIFLNGQPTNLESYTVIDDGIGMDVATLKRALTYSAGSSHDPGDLGKFSVGGTVACCTLGLSRKIYTKKKDGPLLIAMQNFENVLEASEIRRPTPEESKWFRVNVGTNGTVVDINELREDKRKYKRTGDLKNALLKDFGQTFYQLLSSKRSIEISTNSGCYAVKPSDPLYYKTDPKFVHVHKEYKVSFDGGEIYIRTAFLNLDSIDQGEKGYDTQGVYFSRNNRLISKGLAVKNLWVKNPRKNAGRIEISFTEDLDAHFGLTATKNKVSLSQSLTDTLAATIKPFISGLEEKWRKNTDTNTDEIKKENDDFTSKLLRNTGIVDLPKTEKGSPNAQKQERLKGDKKGSVKAKGSGITRKARGVKYPEFIFEENRRSPEVFWTEFPNDEMRIVLNLSHPFVREHWTEGTETSRMLMRKLTTATCLAAFRKKETYHEGAAESFMMDMFHELSRLQMVFGN